MNRESEEKLQAFFAGFAGAGCPLLMLDYDGTLAPFQVNRFQAVPWPGVRELLQSIQSQKRTRMVVITGRPAQEIAPLLGLEEPLEVWGLHGFERLDCDGRVQQQHLPDAVAQKLDELRSLLERDSFGGLFESKPNAAVMHWRGVSGQEAEHIEQRTRAIFEAAARIDGFRLQPFESGLELRAGRDKGGAIDALLAEYRECELVAFLGDDSTDEAGFRALKGRGSTQLSALVRSQWRETDADVWLHPPEELKAFLNRWLEAALHTQGSARRPENPGFL